MTPTRGSGRWWWGSVVEKYLLQCCFISWFLWFDLQHGHVLKKFNFDLLTPSKGKRGIRWQIFATMLLHLVIPFSLICNMTMLWKSYFDLFTQSPGSGGGGFCGQNICDPVAASLNTWISIIIWKMTMFWKSWILTFDPNSRVVGGGGWWQNICYHIAASVILTAKSSPLNQISYFLHERWLAATKQHVYCKIPWLANSQTTPSLPVKF